MTAADDHFPSVDKKHMRRAFQRAAAGYDACAVLQREIADRLLARLDLIKLVPARILDAGCGTGYATRALARRYPRAHIIGMDLAPGMATQACAQRKTHSDIHQWLARGRDRYVCGDAECLPVATASVDMVFSNLVLQWCDARLVFAEFLRVLRPGGVLMFSSFGPDTLRELRRAWAVADAATPHVHAFVDMHDLGDALVRAHFADPVMDAEYLTLTYADVMAVLHELKAIGAHNVAPQRSPGLTGKHRFARFVSAYESQRRPDGTLPATYEVVYGHAWAATSPRASVARADGSVVIPLDRIGRRPVSK